MARSLFNQIMIDIETLGTGPQSPIISIGACRFCLKTGKIHRTALHTTVKWDIERFKADAETIRWWMSQSDEARGAAVMSETTIENGLHMLNEMFKDTCIEGVWANSPSFDLVILKNAYKVCRAEAPWKFWQEMDVRTVRTLGSNLGVERSKNTLKHNALADAKSQALDVIKCVKAIL